MHPAPPPTLVVLLHGLRGDAAQMAGVAALARVAIPGAAVLSPEYHGRTLSNADPARVAAAVDEEIARYHAHWRAKRVVLVGYGIGSELLRCAYLDAWASGAAWAASVDRLVLIAGVGAGWSISPASPHMRRRTRLAIWLGQHFARATGSARLARAFARGAPFVSDVDTRWRLLEQHAASPMVVEVFGDGDGVLAAEAASPHASARRTVVRVRRSTHRDILAVDARPDGSDPATWRPADDPRRERRAVLRAALVGTATELRLLARRRLPRDVIPLDPTAARG